MNIPMLYNVKYRGAGWARTPARIRTNIVFVIEDDFFIVIMKLFVTGVTGLVGYWIAYHFFSLFGIDPTFLNQITLLSGVVMTVMVAVKMFNNETA